MKEKVIYFFNKIKYPIEFLIITLFITGMYKFITIKKYDGYWSRAILIYLVITGILSIVSIVYNCIKDKEKIEKMFLNFAIPIGIMYIVFMILSYTPDASSHIWKAYEVSNGIFFTKIDENGDAKTDVPEVLLKYREQELTNYNILNNIISNSESSNYENIVKVDSPAKTYSFVFYIPYAIGIASARLLSLNIYTGIFLARLINFIVVLIAGYIAIKKIPFGKILLATYLMIPMMLHQSTAVNADSLMNALCILFIAYTLNLCFKKEAVTKKEKIIFLIMTFFIGLVKITYIPLLGLALIFVKRRKDISNKEKIILGSIAIILCLSSLLILNILNRGYVNTSAQQYLQSAGVNSSEQIKGIITNPIGYLGVLINDFIINGEFYLGNFIGQHMGWLSIIVPSVFITMYILLLVVSIYVEDNKEVFDRKEKIWTLFLTILMYVLVITGLYIQWTGVGAKV